MRLPVTIALLAVVLAAPAASAAESMRVMVYCDNVTFTDVYSPVAPSCGTSLREGSSANCVATVGPCYYVDNGVGVGAVVVFPDRFDPNVCGHPYDCHGLVMNPQILGGPCRVLVDLERPGPNTVWSFVCPDKAA